MAGGEKKSLLNSRKLSKNPLSNFSEAGLAEMRKSDIFLKNAFQSVIFENY